MGARGCRVGLRMPKRLVEDDEECGNVFRQQTDSSSPLGTSLKRTSECILLLYQWLPYQ